jgi:hypothetical protein
MGFSTPVPVRAGTIRSRIDNAFLASFCMLRPRNLFLAFKLRTAFFARAHRVPPAHAASCGERGPSLAQPPSLCEPVRHRPRTAIDAGGPAASADSRSQNGVRARALDPAAAVALESNMRVPEDAKARWRCACPRTRRRARTLKPSGARVARLAAPITISRRAALRLACC